VAIFTFKIENFNFCQFLTILATFYELKIWSSKLRGPIFNLMYSESTFSGVSKIINQKNFHALLGLQVPQYDVSAEAGRSMINDLRSDHKIKILKIGDL
jgi:hypothetical protein